MSIQNLVSQALPIIYLCLNEYQIAHRHTQTSIAVASLIWILFKSDINNPIRANSEILLNYLLIKLSKVLKGNNFHFSEFL